MSGGEPGYLRFACRWERGAAPRGPGVRALLDWRDLLRRRGLLGVDGDGVGFGNLSVRDREDGSFLISGTATGGVDAAGPEHFTRVVEADAAANRVRCLGPVRASSESLSHAAVYRAVPAMRAVVHVHHPALWRGLRDGGAPVTDPGAEAGTPAMAAAVERLLGTPVGRAAGLLVMGGHPDGLLSFGGTLDEAGRRMLDALAGLPGPAGGSSRG